MLYNHGKRSVEEEQQRSSEINLFFTTANGAKIPIKINPNLSVQSLKTEIIHVMRNHRFYAGTLNAQLEQGSKLELQLGGETLDDVRSVSSYALVNGSVVHPRWGSVHSAFELKDAFAWLDPDWHQEINNRNMRVAGDFLDLVYSAPGPTVGRMFWPGPINYPNGITERRAPAAARTPAHPRYLAADRAGQAAAPTRPPPAARATRGWDDPDAAAAAAAAAARRSDGLLIL